jgi:hypothetical protein
MIYVLIVNLIFLMTNFPHKFPTYDKNATKRTFPALYSLPLPEQANMWHLNKHLKKKKNDGNEVVCRRLHGEKRDFLLLFPVSLVSL